MWAATLIAALVAGQMVASLVVDHFGWIGFPVHHVSAGRVVGLVLLFAGCCSCASSEPECKPLVFHATSASSLRALARFATAKEREDVACNTNRWTRGSARRLP